MFFSDESNNPNYIDIDDIPVVIEHVSLNIGNII